LPAVNLSPRDFSRQWSSSAGINKIEPFVSGGGAIEYIAVKYPQNDIQYYPPPMEYTYRHKKRRLRYTKKIKKIDCRFPSVIKGNLTQPYIPKNGSVGGGG